MFLRTLFRKLRTRGSWRFLCSSASGFRGLRDGRPHRLKHDLYGFFPAQAAASFERAPGVEVDRQSEHRKQVPSPFAANLPTLCEQLADRPEVEYNGALEQAGKSGHCLRVS